MAAGRVLLQHPPGRGRLPAGPLQVQLPPLVAQLRRLLLAAGQVLLQHPPGRGRLPAGPLQVQLPPLVAQLRRLLLAAGQVLLRRGLERRPLAAGWGSLQHIPIQGRLTALVQAPLLPVQLHWRLAAGRGLLQHLLSRGRLLAGLFLVQPLLVPQLQCLLPVHAWNSCCADGVPPAQRRRSDLLSFCPCPLCRCSAMGAAAAKVVGPLRSPHWHRRRPGGGPAALGRSSPLKGLHRIRAASANPGI